MLNIFKQNKWLPIGYIELKIDSGTQVAIEEEDVPYHSGRIGNVVATFTQGSLKITRTKLMFKGYGRTGYARIFKVNRQDTNVKLDYSMGHKKDNGILTVHIFKERK